jgi:hypothetical protein
MFLSSTLVKVEERLIRIVVEIRAYHRQIGITKNTFKRSISSRLSVIELNAVQEFR